MCHNGHFLLFRTSFLIILAIFLLFFVIFRVFNQETGFPLEIMHLRGFSEMDQSECSIHRGNVSEMARLPTLAQCSEFSETSEDSKNIFSSRERGAIFGGVTDFLVTYGI